MAGWGRELGGRFYTNLFAARPGASLLGEWIRRQDEVLDRAADWPRLSWGALVQEILWPIAQRWPHYAYPIDRIAPAPSYQWRRLLSRWQSPVEVIKHRPLAIMLWNSPMGPRLKDVRAESIKTGRSLLSRLLRIALGESTIKQETDVLTAFHPMSQLRYSRVGRSLDIRLHWLAGRRW